MPFSTQSGSLRRSAVKGALAPAAAVALAAVAITGCGGSSGQHQPTAAPAHPTAPPVKVTTPSRASTPAPAATPVSSTVASSSSAPAVASDPGVLTQPGTKLKVGQAAVVNDDEFVGLNQTVSYKVRITVKSVKAGKMSDLNGMSLTGVPAGATPTYATIEVTNLSGKALPENDDPSSSVGAILRDGSLDSGVMIFGDFPKCPSNPISVVPPGVSYTTCETLMEKGGVQEMGYDGSSDTFSDPVLWTL